MAEICHHNYRQKEHTTIAFHQNPHGHGRSHLGNKLIRSYNISNRIM